MKTSFQFDKGTWNARWPERISQYDLVCLSPPLDPIQGLPLGNGDVGALVWCEPQKLCIAVNKCDLWDDDPKAAATQNDPDAEYWKNSPYYEEVWSSLRHACRLEIDLGQPLMDSWYLKDFEARLDLAHGRALIRSTTPFGSFEAKVFVDAHANVLAVDYAIRAEEPVRPRVTMYHWGSRIFHCWYNQIRRDPSFGLSGTRTSVHDTDLLIEQQLRALRFTVAGCVRDENKDVPPSTDHSRSGVFQPEPAAAHSGQVFLSVVNSEEVSDCTAASRKLLAASRKAGIAGIEEQHNRFWRKFWNGFHVRLQDKFQENMWHLTSYYAAATQRGRYPGLFTMGLWAWNRDFQAWSCKYYHWNQQQLTWPLPAAGHPELLRPYLDYRFSMLPMARITAAKQGKKGAHYYDVADRLGYQVDHPNRTPSGQIAADFWRYFRYTGDTQYLREKGWPVISEAARWHFSCLEKETDGLYHATPAWGYEGGLYLKDCTTELATTRRTFTIALEAAGLLGISDPDLEEWREALEHLAPIVTMESPKNKDVTIHAAGYQKGHREHAVGYGGDEGGPQEWKDMQPTCCHDSKKWGQIFGDVETSVVFPSGNLGLKDAGTEDFSLAVATARECLFSWTTSIVWARLGLRAELSKTLPTYLGNWLGQPREISISGFYIYMHCGYWDTFEVADPLLAPQDHCHAPPEAWDAFKKSRSPFRKWEFRHLGQEMTYLHATIINESLLQSYDGTIRVAPAVPEGSPFAFTLLAEGGFVVSAEGTGDHVDWIHIHSTRGEECRVANPWPGKSVHRLEMGTKTRREASGAEIAFPTEKGAMYLLAAEPLDWKTGSGAPEDVQTNTGPRLSADPKVTLGIPRMF